jgi:hypothetical protein
MIGWTLHNLSLAELPQDWQAKSSGLRYRHADISER